MESSEDSESSMDIDSGQSLLTNSTNAHTHVANCRATTRRNSGTYAPMALDDSTANSSGAFSASASAPMYYLEPPHYPSRNMRPHATLVRRIKRKGEELEYGSSTIDPEDISPSKCRKTSHSGLTYRDIPFTSYARVRFRIFSEKGHELQDPPICLPGKIMCKEPWGLLVELLESYESPSSEGALSLSKGARFWTKWDGAAPSLLIGANSEEYTPGFLYFRPGIAPLDTRSWPSLDESRLRDLETEFSPQTVHQFLLKLKGPMTRAERQQIEAISELKLGFHIPKHAFFVEATNDAIRAAQALPFVDWVSEYSPQLRIDPTIGPDTDTVVVAVATAHPRARRAYELVDEWNAQLRALGLPGALALEPVTESFHNAQENNRRRSRLELLVLTFSEPNATPSGKMATISWLSKQPATHFIEPQLQMHLFNKYATYIVQSNDKSYEPLYSQGIDGEGQVVGCYDSGIDWDHCFFNDPDHDPPLGTVSQQHRKLLAYYRLSQDGTPITDYSDTIDGHGTHVTGSIVGAADYPLSSADENAAAAFNGAAPGAKLFFVDGANGNEQDIVQINDVAGILFSAAYDSGVKLFSNSWGCGSADGSLPNSCLVYNTQAASIDSFVESNHEFLPIFAAGNSGPGQNTLPTPALAKNILTVGATRSAAGAFKSAIDYQDYYLFIEELGCTGSSCPQTPSECCASKQYEPYCCPSYFEEAVKDATDDNIYFSPDTMASFSSQGPADFQGRYKPDVVAPGQFVTSAHSDGDTSTYQCGQQTPQLGNAAALLTLQGTSMAAPITAGVAALVRQYFEDGYYPTGTAKAANAFSPSAALVKATIIASAVPLKGYYNPTASSGLQPLSKASDHARQYATGFGRVTVGYILPLANGADVSLFVADEDSRLDTGEVASYRIVCGGKRDTLEVVLAWTDPASSPNSAGTLINNLDLRVLNGDDGNRTLFSSTDSINNVERAIITGVEKGQVIYIEVHGKEVNVGPQVFALVAVSGLSSSDFSGNEVISSAPSVGSFGSAVAYATAAVAIFAGAAALL